MKLLYLTSKRYPSTTADHVFIKYMSRAFTRMLGEDFTLFIAGPAPAELHDIRTHSVASPRHLKSVFYFFWIPLFVATQKHATAATTFISNDPYLLSILIFWKRTLGFHYRICSDWHLLFDDARDAHIATHSDFLVTTTNQLKELLVSASGIEGKKILVAYGGVDLDAFAERPAASTDLRMRLGVPASDFLVGYVGFYTTMGMRKGLDTMLNALGRIQGTRIKMVFVGGRPEEIEEYARIAQDLGVADRAFFLPTVPSDDVPTYEMAMDALVIPYPDQPHFRKYGFPMKVYEYMASKRPILYSALPIIAEVLGDCAIPVTPDDAKDLAEKIIALEQEPEHARSRTERAYEKVQDYTWEARAAHVIDFVRGT